MKRDAFSQVAESLPLDNTSPIPFYADNAQAGFEEVRTNHVLSLDTTATTAAGTLTLLSTSKSVQLLTGTATGYSVVLPSATTLFVGRKFEIYNASSQPVTVKTNGGATLFTLSQSSIGYITLRDAGTAAGTWYFWQVFVSSLATGILNYQVSSTTSFTSASTTDVLITGFTVTPEAGTYAVWVNLATQNTSGTATNSGGFYKAGVSVAGTDRSVRMSAANSPLVLSTMAVILFNGTEACDFRVRTSSASQTVLSRTMLLIRLGG